MHRRWGIVLVGGEDEHEDGAVWNGVRWTRYIGGLCTMRYTSGEVHVEVEHRGADDGWCTLVET